MLRTWLRQRQEPTPPATRQGRYNDRYDESRDKWVRGNTYRDLSTVVLIVTKGMVPARVVQAWLSLIHPPNQRVQRVVIEGHEVGLGYQEGVRAILGDPHLRTFKYVFTLEEDNLPPPDAMLRLYESITDYDIVGGLYWMKAEGGTPVCFGDPQASEFNVRPVVPPPNTVMPVTMIGLGCTLWRTDVFRTVPEPWFQTVVDYDEATGGTCMTQDVPFFAEAWKRGLRVGVDSRVRVGHMSADGTIW